MNRQQIQPETVAQIAACGFDLYAPADGLTTYLFYTDGTRIAYLQNDRLRGWTISTVHKPNKTTGTGFGIEESVALTRDSLLRGFAFAPHWASGRDRESVEKYTDIAQFLRVRTFSPLRLIATANGTRLIESTSRADYWQGANGVFQAVQPGADAPTGGAGYFDLDALKRLKGDSA